MPLAVRAHPSERRVVTLDGLRGVAVILVLLHHLLTVSPLLEAPLGSWGSYARVMLGLPTASGVDLFFVLSGFLVGGILLDYRDSSRLLPTFYLRRFLRIVPLAWLCIASVWLMATLLGIRHVEGPAGWWTYLAFTVNLDLAAYNDWWFSWLTPLWSVAIEEQFYLVLPIIVRIWPAHRLRWLGPALIAVAWCSRAAILLLFPEHAFACHVLMPCRLDAFGCGVTAAWFVRSKGWRRWQDLGGHRWLLLAPPAAALALLLKLHASSTARVSWGYAAIAAFYALVLLLVYRPAERWLERALSSGVLRVYGRCSYFIYLFQSLLISVVLGYLFYGRWDVGTPATWVQAAVGLVIVLPPAWVSWRWFERPLLQLGQRFSYE